jgi:toxin HigB-1
VTSFVCDPGQSLIGRREPLCQLVTREVTGYTRDVAIRGFRHKGLELFFTTGKTSRIQAHHAARLRLILGRLNVATEPRDMYLPGLQLHELKGNRRRTWAVSVSGNWRVTFVFVGKDVDEVDYEDYH